MPIATNARKESGILQTCQYKTEAIETAMVHAGRSARVHALLNTLGVFWYKVAFYTLIIAYAPTIRVS